MKILYLLFSEEEALPHKGDEVLMCGLAGLYRVKIQQVLSHRHLSGGTILLRVRATRRLRPRMFPHTCSSNVASAS